MFVSERLGRVNNTLDHVNKCGHVICHESGHVISGGHVTT
jgi:hypothetical protein